MSRNKKYHKHTKKNTLLTKIIFLVCLIVLICALAVGIWQQQKKHQENEDYEQLRNDVETEQIVGVIEAEEESVEIPIDFDAVQSQYPNAYAWITIPDTPVDYPIMQSSADMDEDYYLDHTIDGEKNLPAAIYTQRSQNGKNMTDLVTVIYGHNMRNDSMFGSLNEYTNEEYRQAHPYIYVYTPEHIFKYEIFGAVTYTDDHILYTYNCNMDSEGYAEFLESLKETSVSPSWINGDIEVTTEDRIIVLSTCNNNDSQRYLICAVLVEEQ